MPISLKEYAKKNGISYRTAHRAFKAGKIKNARQVPSGKIIVDEDPQMDRLEKATERLEKVVERMEKLK
jgi:predicted site-specific integrase-resolvase